MPLRRSGRSRSSCSSASGCCRSARRAAPARLQRPRAHAGRAVRPRARRGHAADAPVGRRRGRDPAALGADRRDRSSRAWSPTAATSSCSPCSARARSWARARPCSPPATRCCCRAPGRRSTSSLDDPDVLRRRLARRSCAARPCRSGRAPSAALVVLAAMVLRARDRLRAGRRRRPARGRRDRSCCACSRSTQATARSRGRRSSWSAAMIPLSTAMTETGAAGKLADDARRRRRRRRPLRAAARPVRADGRARPADQQHGDGADRDPDRGLGRRPSIGVSPQPVLMCVTVAAAASFLTPVATPANLMVMGPGGYRFGDYWKLGLPLLVALRRRRRPARAGVLVVLSADLRRALRLDRAAARTRARCEALVAEAYERYRDDDEGAISQRLPGARRGAGRALRHLRRRHQRRASTRPATPTLEFTIMSVSKPFVFALVCEALGAERARERLGVNATGLPFNSVDGGRARARDGRTNPMVNSGAIATTSLVPGVDAEARWERSSTTACRASPGARARARRRGLRVGVGDEPPQPRRSPACSRATAGSTATRPRRSTSTRGSARSPSPRRDLAADGRDARRRRRQPAHRRARRRRRRSAATRSR